MKTKICVAFTLSLLSLPLLATDYYLIKNETATKDYCSLDGRGSNLTEYSGWAETETGMTKVPFGNSYGAVDPNGVYHMNGHILRGKPKSMDSYSFQGGELVFDGTNPAINDKMNNGSTLTIGNLRVVSGTHGEIRNGDNSHTKKLAGTWTIAEGGMFGLNMGDEVKSTRSFVCSAKVLGEGIFAATAGIGSNASANGSVTLDGDLSDFEGVLSAGEKGATYTGTHADAVKNHSLVIGDASSFPQATPNNVLLERSIVVTNGATISFTCDVTSPVNRGWDFGNGAQPTVNVDSDKTVTILGPVKGSVGFKKTGGGTLILNVGGTGAFDEITLTGTRTVTDERLAEYVANCDEYINSGGKTVAILSLSMNGGTSVTVLSRIRALALGEGESATLTILYGTDSDALTERITVGQITADGNMPVTIKGLTRGTTYYFKSDLELPDNSTVESEVLPITTITDYMTGMRRVEYIEGTGSQYIDSGYYPGPNTHVKADYQFTAIENQHRVFGIKTGTYFGAYINGNGKFGYVLSDSATWSAVGDNAPTACDTNRYLHDFNYINENDLHAYTIYGPDGSVKATQSPLAGSATKTATVTLTISADRKSATEVEANEIAKHHRIYSVLFDEGGTTLTAALAPVVRSSDGAVGLYDSIRNMFLPSASTVPYVAGPTIVTAEHYTGTGLTAVDLTFLGAPYARTLKIAYGSGFGGDNPADWDVTNTVGTVAAGATSCTVTAPYIPSNWGSTDACVLRCYFDDGTSFPLWSDAVVYRGTSEPIISGVTVDGTGGDMLVVRGTLDYIPDDSCALSVRVTKSGGSPVVWSSLTNVTEAGNFELTLLESDPAAERYIEPGATYSVVVEGTSGEATGSSTSVAVTTKGAPVFLSSNSSVNRRKVTFNGNLFDLGVGTNTTVTLYVGETQNALVAVEKPVVRTATGSFTIYHTFAEVEKTYYWQFRAVCTTASGRTLETRTAVASCKTLDKTTYTWRAVNGDWNGDWNDPAHWTPSYDDCLGYPQTLDATADFKDCTTDNPVVVSVNGKYKIGELKYYGSGASDITFAGTSTNESSLSASVTYGQNGIKANSKVEFRDMTLTRAGSNWDFQRDNKDATNILVRFSNVYSTGVMFGMSAAFSRLEFIDSEITCSSRFNFGSSNSVLVVSNSKIDMDSYDFHFGADVGIKGPVEMIISGKDSRIRAKRFFVYSHSDGYDATITLMVPVGGFAEVPLQQTGDAKFQNGGGANSKIKFAVSPASPALRRSNPVLENHVIVSTKNGFETGRVGDGSGGIGDGQEGVPGWAFKWGVNRTATSDTTAARQILLVLQGKGNPPTMFLIY